MRIYEFTSAEEQLALWKLISDKTWLSISQQAEAERRDKAEKAARSKIRGKRGGKQSTPKPIPRPPPTTPPEPPSNQVQNNTATTTHSETPDDTKSANAELTDPVQSISTSYGPIRYSTTGTANSTTQNAKPMQPLNPCNQHYRQVP
jgi:type II secretory pathway pseudopilin PulG